MKIEKIYCDRCGREISPLMNKPSITLQKKKTEIDSSGLYIKKDTEIDLCGLCITSFFRWFNDKPESEESE